MRHFLGLALAIVLAATLAPRGATADPGPRRWHVGAGLAATWRDGFDVFERDDLPPGSVAVRGNGGGLQVGRLFGDRFVLAFHATGAEHTADGADRGEQVLDVEALVTGTVLFGGPAVVQPFLRGGTGVGGIVVDLPGDAGNVFSYGTAAIAGGGCLVHLGSRISLELEAVATFTNFIEVQNESDDPRWTADSWQVRASDQGWRVGAGLLFRF